MKIGFFNGYSIWGGGEKWHFEMSSYCQDRGDEALFFTPISGELAKRVLKSGNRVVDIKIGKHSYYNPLTLASIFFKIRKEKLDLLIFNSFADVRVAALIGKFAGVKKVIFRCGMPIAPKEDLSFKLNFRYGLDQFVPISKAIQDEFDQKAPSLLSESQKVPFIANGIDLDRFSYIESPNNSPLILGNAVRLSHQKGIDYLLPALKLLKERGHLFVMKIAGEGELEEDLLQMSFDLGLSDYIEFVGHIEDVSDFVKDLDLYLFTSRYEGTARSIIEAMGCGKAVIAFNTSSMKEMVVDGESGFLVTAFDTKEYADKIEILINNPSLREKFGKKGRLLVERDFNKVKNFKKWYNFLSSLT